MFSANGEHVAVETAIALSTSDTDGVPDIYELSPGTSPQLITTGTSLAETRPVAVADNGEQVLYEVLPLEGAGVVDEWVRGDTAELSPRGASRPEEVLGTAGPELEDVFFASNGALVGQDAERRRE